MSTSKLLSIATIVPPNHHSLDDMIFFLKSWTHTQDTVFCEKAEKIFLNASVDTRNTVLSLADALVPRTFEENNAIYKSWIVKLAAHAFSDALQKANVQPEQIDCIITTSCTGHMSPSLETHLVNQFNMKKTVQRLPVTEMGCAGGAAGLTYVSNYLKAYPGRYVALICGELTSLTFQREDFSWANIVSTAIFADGVACVIFGPSDKPGLVIQDVEMNHLPGTENLLGFDLSNTGFKMVLDETLPTVIRNELSGIMEPFLTRNQLTAADIRDYVVHPGGKKILHNIELMINKHGKNLDASWAILKRHGNLSSATVLFILNEVLMTQSLTQNDKILLMAFGPGVMANQVLLSYES